MKVIKINRAELCRGKVKRHNNNKCCPIGHFFEQTNPEMIGLEYHIFEELTGKGSIEFFDTFDSLFGRIKQEAEEFAVKYMEGTNYTFEFYGKYRD